MFNSQLNSVINCLGIGAQVATICAGLSPADADKAVGAALANRVRVQRKLPTTEEFQGTWRGLNGSVDAATEINELLRPHSARIEELVVIAGCSDVLRKWGLVVAEAGGREPPVNPDWKPPQADPAPQPDPKMTENFLRRLLELHIGKPMRLEIVAINGMAKPGDDASAGMRTRTQSIRLHDRAASETDLPVAMDWVLRLHQASIDPRSGVAWNLYYGLHLIPDGADRKTAVKAGGAPLAVHIDIDSGEPEEILAKFCARTEIPRAALDIVTTGTKPNLRMQALLRCGPQPGQLDRLKALAEDLGADVNVYSPTQVLRLPGSVAWPFKGGVEKADRVAEVVTWTRPTVAFAGAPILPMAKAKAAPPRAERAPSEPSADWTEAQHAAARSYAEAQARKAAELPDTVRFVPRAAIIRQQAILVAAGLGAEADVDVIVDACEAETEHPGRYRKLAAEILADTYGEHSAVPEDALERAIAEAEGVKDAIRAGAKDAEEIDQHRRWAYVRRQNATDWLAKAAEQGLKPEDFMGTPLLSEEEERAGRADGAADKRREAMVEALRLVKGHLRKDEYGNALLAATADPAHRKALVDLGLVIPAVAGMQGEVSDEADQPYVGAVVWGIVACLPVKELVKIIGGEQPEQREIAVAHVLAANAAKAAKTEGAFTTAACKLLAVVKALNITEAAREAAAALFDLRAGNVKFTDFARSSGDERHASWAARVVERLNAGTTALQAIKAADREKTEEEIERGVGGEVDLKGVSKTVTTVGRVGEKFGRLDVRGQDAAWVDRSAMRVVSDAHVNKTLSGQVVSWPDDDGKIRYDEASGAWMSWNRQHRFTEIAFTNAPAAPSVLTLFKGYGVEPAGDNSKCEKILQHVSEVICAGDAKKNEALLNLLAWQVQNVGKCSRIILVLVSGEQQTGKGAFAVNLMGRIWGHACANISNKEPLVGRFNDVWAGCAWAVLDEVAFAGDRAVGDAIKRLSAADHMKLEGKGKPQIDYPMGVNFCMLSNHAHAAHIEKGDMRHFVLEVADHRQGDAGYFDDLFAEIEGEGAGAFLGLLLKRDVSNFKPVRDVPRDNAAKRSMQSASTRRGSVEDWLGDVVAAASFNPAGAMGVPQILFSGHNIDEAEQALELAEGRLQAAQTVQERDQAQRDLEAAQRALDEAIAKPVEVQVESKALYGAYLAWRKSLTGPALEKTEPMAHFQLGKFGFNLVSRKSFREGKKICKPPQQRIVPTREELAKAIGVNLDVDR